MVSQNVTQHRRTGAVDETLDTWATKLATRWRNRQVMTRENSTLGSGRTPNLRWGLASGYPALTAVMGAGPPAGTCGGGLARGLYETITPIELATMLGAARPDSLA